MNIKSDIYIKIILVMAILVNCSNCGAEIYKSACFIKRSKNLFCGNECKVKYMKGRGTGEDNPNFGKKWDDERKKVQSEIIKSKVDDEYRLNCARGMKGREVKTETKDQRKKTMLERYGRLSNTTKLSDEAKTIIGKKSSEKFTDEFKAKQYEVMVERGLWVSREAKNPYHFYRSLANWNCNVLDFNVIGSDLFYEFGYFNINTNTKGMVRDHRFSRLSGFKNLVFPEILRHPFNCEFIQHGDNARKHHSKKINSDSVTIEELLEGIKEYNNAYSEQSICLEKIKQYESGLRYEAKDYIKIY
jgi:hypothetical protein